MIEPSEHCVDNARDREIGAYWERQFCRMAMTVNKTFTANQINRLTAANAFAPGENGEAYKALLLPDVVIWTAPGEHHEIKSKYPTKAGRYGLEVYRLEALVRFALVTQQDVMYTIHDTDRAGGKHVKENRLSDWVTANVLHLAAGRPLRRDDFPSWVRGKKHDNVPQYFWRASVFIPLAEYWGEQRLRFGA